MEEEGHVCRSPFRSWGEPVGVWNLLVLCLVGEGGYLAAGVPIWSGRSLSDMMPAFYRTFPLFFGLSEKDYLLIIKKLNVQCCTTCPKH